MRKSKPIILHLPTLFILELDKYLEEYPPQFTFDMNNFYYLYHYITVNHQIQKKKDYVYINLNNLKEMTVSNIERYRKVLIDGGFIISDNKAIPKKRSNKYKLNPIFLNGEVTPILLSPDTNIFKKIIAYQRKKKAHYDRLEPFLKEMNKAFKELDFDYRNAEKWIYNHADKDKIHNYLSALSRIQDKRFRYFKRNKTNNRLDTNLTNLKSELKIFIIGDYVNIDLKNSQPFFFSQLIWAMLENSPQIIEDKSKELGVPREKQMQLNKIKQPNKQEATYCHYLDKDKLLKTFGKKTLREFYKIHQNMENYEMVNLLGYTNSVLKGTLYDDFLKIYSGDITRDEVKEIVFRVMFSGEWNKYGKKQFPLEKKVFASTLPFIYDAMKIIKEKDYKLLSVFLQELESYIFIDCIAKELVNAGIIPFTVHDSILIQSRDERKAMEIVNQVFLEKFGMIPTFHVNPIKKEIETFEQENMNLKLCA